MWWQYVVTIIATLFVALIAVRFDHWLLERKEYRKAINCVKDEIETDIKLGNLNCEMIDDDLISLEKGDLRLIPYLDFHDLSWSTWKSVILVRNPEVANRIDEAYFHVPTTNNLLRRIDELEWSSITIIVDVAVIRKGNLEKARRYISEELLPRLKEVEELIGEGK